ncbi:MAG TPA: hypothetical protein VFR86_13845 [Burkholderiaceae bacterium]|nr:hypothetical protein [Burkholderiaceae bacterium]
MGCCKCNAAAAALLALGGFGIAQAAEPEWGFKATALGGAPIDEGAGHSARVTLEPSVKVKGSPLELRAHARLRYLDQVDDERADADLRELTAAWRGGDASLTVGAQQVNWGRMDILRVTDVVNPIDRHDLFYEELPEAKLASWMVNAEWQHESQVVQFVAAPHVAIDRVPRRLGGLPVQITRPSASLDNATYALRYGFEVAAWNADLVAVRGWQTSPELFPVVDASGLRLQGALFRQNSAGFSADRPFGSIVLRVEGLYARVTPHDLPAGFGLTAQRLVTLAGGADLRSGSWFFAGQVIAQRNLDAAAGFGAPRNNAYVSGIVQRKWLQERLTTRALHIRETHFGSSWTSLQATYELSPHQEVRVQADWFRGQPTEPFGAFADRSRVAASLRLAY